MAVERDGVTCVQPWPSIGLRHGRSYLADDADYIPEAAMAGRTKKTLVMDRVCSRFHSLWDSSLLTKEHPTK
jgi:hypothetical protein